MPELTPHDAAIYKAESERLDRMHEEENKREDQALRSTYLYGALSIISLISILALFYMSKY